MYMHTSASIVQNSYILLPAVGTPYPTRHFQRGLHSQSLDRHRQTRKNQIQRKIQQTTTLVQSPLMTLSQETRPVIYSFVLF